MASEAEKLWGIIYETYTIHKETLQHTDYLLKKPVKSYTEVGFEEARKSYLEEHRELNGVPHFDGNVSETVVDCSSSHKVPVSVYVPASKPKVPAILVYFHGGGLLIGDRETHEASLKALSDKSGCIVINTEYRLLPDLEHPMAPFEDCAAVVNWVVNHKDFVGGHSDSKIGVGGDSAGGQIIGCILPEVRGVDFQVLVYPTVDMNFDQFPSSKEFFNCPMFNTQSLRERFRVSNGDIPDPANNPRVNVAARKSLDGSPPAIIVYAQFDPLVDAIIAYGKRLLDCGVDVEVHRIDGVPHGFFSLPGIYKECCNEMFEHIACFITKFH